MPRFKGDALVDDWSDGDVVVQVCANDPQVAFHGIRNLARIARGKLSCAGSSKASSAQVPLTRKAPLPAICSALKTGRTTPMYKMRALPMRSSGFPPLTVRPG